MNFNVLRRTNFPVKPEKPGSVRLLHFTSEVALKVILREGMKTPNCLIAEGKKPSQLPSKMLPDQYDVMFFEQPAFPSASTCNCTSCSRLLTRAYPTNLVIFSQFIESYRVLETLFYKISR